MTKIYDIISLNNELYVVDNEYPIGGKFVGISEREGPIFGEIKSFQNNHINGDGSSTDTTGWNTNWYYPKVPIGVFHIIATTDKSLNLPLLPDVEESFEQKVIKIVKQALVKGQQFELAGIFRDEERRIVSSLYSPKQVELEVEERQFSYEGAFKVAMDKREEMESLKIVDNHVVVKRYIYE